MAPLNLDAHRAVLSHLQSYAAVCLVLGNGPKRGYADASAAALAARAALDPLLARGRVLAVFNGDTALPARPDLGMVVKHLRGCAPGLDLLAVQSWAEVDDHVDFVHRHAEGETYAGVGVGGELVGASAVYFAPEFAAACPGGTLHVVAVGTGGRAGAAEIAYAEKAGLPVTRVPAADASGRP